MAKKTDAELLATAAAALERKNAELAKAKAENRGERLRKAEVSVHAAVGRKDALRNAEIAVAAGKPRNTSMVWDETVAKPDNVVAASKRGAKPLWNEMAPSKAAKRNASRIMT